MFGNSMIRLAIILFSAYTFGHGHFAGYRPQLIDRSLVEFHRTVNIVAADITEFGPDFRKAAQPTHILAALKPSF
jgi:hypothetical protein